jgi:hypothetical protein
MPYSRDREFARIRELIETIEQLALKEGHSAIPDISQRAVKIINKYFDDPADEV